MESLGSPGTNKISIETAMNKKIYRITFFYMGILLAGACIISFMTHLLINNNSLGLLIGMIIGFLWGILCAHGFVKKIQKYGLSHRRSR